MLCPSCSSSRLVEIDITLRERRVTIILVTHESHIADYTQRIVTFRDGRIVSDLPRAESRHALEIVRG